ncbi:MAG: hypothetical protein EB170_07920 [Nitrosopumilaceae archaeon]|nr:hypothetical protein [Nitrosopumilaceae archaeon]
MDTFEAIESRRAIKSFDPNYTIPKQEIDKISIDTQSGKQTYPRPASMHRDLGAGPGKSEYSSQWRPKLSITSIGSGF